MTRKNLLIPFFLALFFAIYGTILFPTLRIWPFSPFLAYLFHKSSFSKSLWISFFCGLILDLISSQFRFGLFSLIHVFTAFFLYSQKKHFFEDKPLGLSLYTALLSAFSSFFLLLFSSWDHQVVFSLPLIASDLVLMPLLDALYAFLWFTCPISLFFYLKKYGLKRLYATQEDN